MPGGGPRLYVTNPTPAGRISVLCLNGDSQQGRRRESAAATAGWSVDASDNVKLNRIGTLWRAD